MITSPAFLDWAIPDEVNTTNPPAALLAWHDGRCATCGEIHRLVEDHDHETGWTRGYLCRKCNLREATQPDPGFALYRERPPAAVLGLRFPYAPNRTSAHKPTRATLTLRAPAELKERLDAHAARLGVPANAAALTLLDTALRAEKKTR